MSLQSEQLSGDGLRKIAAGVGAGLAALGVSAALTYGYLQARDYQEHHNQWVELQTLEKAGEYEGCLAGAQAIAPGSRYFAGAQSLLQQCRLGQAQQQAGQEDYAAAIASALLIPKSNEESYQQAQPLIQTWSDALVKQGQDLLQAGQIGAAIAKLQALPAESPAAKDTEATIKRWQADWAQSENAIKNAENLLARGQWLSAKQSLGKVTSIAFWQRKAKPLLTKAEAGIALVEQYEAEQYKAGQYGADPYPSSPAAGLAAAPSAVYTPPAWDAPAEYEAPPAEYWQADPGAISAPAPQPSSYAAEYSAPPVAAAAAPPPSEPNFDQSVQGLYQSYQSQGQGTWDAWSQACADSGGRLVDQGPESACLP